MKKILITGSSTGIGFECAKYFIKKGWNVFGHYFEKNNNVEEIKSIKGNECYYCDFSDDRAIKDFIDKLELLEFDALINNAGCFDFSKNSDNRIHAIEKVLKINLIVPVLLSEVIMEKMKKRKSGCIINISSIGAKYGSNLDNIFYGITKRGIESATKSLAREGADYNVLVNSIRPGVTNTEFYNKLGKDISKRVELIPLKRSMEAEELAKFIYFMCSENTFITNEIITIAGGE